MIEHLTEGGVGLRDLLERALPIGPVQVPRRVGLVELHDQELRRVDVDFVHGGDDTSIGSVAQATARCAIGQLALGRPVRIRTQRPTDMHEILVAEDADGAPTGSMAVVEQGRRGGADLLGGPPLAVHEGPTRHDAVHVRRDAGHEGRVVRVGGRGEDGTASLRCATALRGQLPEHRRPIRRDVTVREGVEDGEGDTRAAHEGSGLRVLRFGSVERSLPDSRSRPNLPEWIR